MKKIRIEDADSYTNRASIKDLNKGNLHKNIVFPMHKWESIRWIYRFINSYIGKPYDKLYSDFITKMKNDRKFKNGITFIEMKNWFLYYFNSKYSSLFYIDKGGNVRKIKKASNNDLNKDFLYKLNIDENFYPLFSSYFDEKELKKFLSGVIKPVYENFIRQPNANALLNEIRDRLYPYWTPKKNAFNFDDIFIKVAMDKKLTYSDKKKTNAEIKDYNNKKKRTEKKKRESLEEKILIKRLKTSDELIKANKLSVKEAEKQLKKENQVTRDRLGFDEESFRTPQKFQK